jgi:hypothetical protein
LETEWQDDLKACKGLIKYQKKTDSWFVVSGVSNHYVFYHKLFAQGRNWAGFHITYPEAKKASSGMLRGFFIERDKGPIHPNGRRCPT